MLIYKYHKPLLMFCGLSFSINTTLNRYLFSSMLSSQAQRAIISHHTMRFIRLYSPQQYLNDPRSIREKIVDRKLFKQDLLLAIRQCNNLNLKKQQINLEWLNEQFEDKHYDQVFKGFQISQGAPLNKDISPQDRMFQATINQNIALFPVYSNQLFYEMSKDCWSGIISGHKGTGKSMAIFSLSYFNHFKLKFQIKHRDKQSNFKSCIDQSLWKTVPYICYINIKEILDYNFYFKQIMLQFTDLYPIKEIRKDFLISIDDKKDPRLMTKSQLMLLLKTIKQRAQKFPRIKTVCYIDQANKIFRLLRKLKAWVIQNKNQKNFMQAQLWKNTIFYKDLTFYFQLLSIFMDQSKDTSFHNIIYISSQNFELQLFEDTAIPQQVKDSLPILTLFKSRRQFGLSKTTNDDSQINKKIGQIELYQMMWFQILRHLQRKQLLGSIKINLNYEKMLSEHKCCFNETFGLFIDQSMRNDSKEMKIQKWDCQITHLDIRQFFMYYKAKDIAFLSKIDNIFASEKLTIQQKQQFTKDLKKAKVEIQQYMINRIAESMIKYIKKGVSYKENFQRMMILKDILSEGQKYCEQQINNLKKRSLKYDSYEYLKNENTSSKMILVETINIGFVDKGKLMFNMNPQRLVSSISLALVADNYFEQVAKNILLLALDPQTIFLNQDVGRVLDRLSFPIFKNGNINLQYTQRKIKNDEINQQEKIISQPQTKAIGQTCFIEQITSAGQYKSGIFDKVIEAANKAGHNEYIAGYPIKNMKNGRYVPSDNNILFDCLIAKKIYLQQKKKHKYNILFYDWTFGRPASKERKELISNILSYLKMAKINSDIDCKLLIVAPNFFIDSYILWYNEHHQTTQQQYKLFQSLEHKEVINGVSFTWNISIGVAAFNEQPFFAPKGESTLTSIIMATIQKCYIQVQKKYEESKISNLNRQAHKRKNHRRKA